MIVRFVCTRCQRVVRALESPVATAEELVRQDELFSRGRETTCPCGGSTIPIDEDGIPLAGWTPQAFARAYGCVVVAVFMIVGIVMAIWHFAR